MKRFGTRQKITWKSIIHLRYFVRIFLERENSNQFFLQNVETRVFSPSVYTVGAQRPKIQEGGMGTGPGRKRKTSDSVPNGGKRGKRNGATNV